jgi:hypothetical protein
MRQATDQSHPLHTISDPNGNPYISVIDVDQTVRIQLHNYDDLGRYHLVLDKKCLPQLIDILRLCRHSDEIES